MINTITAIKRLRSANSTSREPENQPYFPSLVHSTTNRMNECNRPPFI